MTDESDFITVDKDRMTQCVWCGTIKSQNLIPAGTKAKSPSINTKLRPEVGGKKWKETTQASFMN